MAKILIYETDENLLDLLKANLETEIGAELFCCTNHQQVKSVLENRSNLNCLLLRSSYGSQKNAQSILNFMKLKKLSLKTIVLGSIEEADNQNQDIITLNKDIKIRELLSILKKELNISEDDIKNLNIPDFFGFKLHYFFLVHKFESDVYLKIKKKDGDQYVKRIMAGDEFDKKLLLKYKQSGLEELYVEKEYRHRFLDILIGENIERLKSLFKNAGDFSEEQIMQLSNDSYNLSQDLLISLGLSEQAIKMTKASIKTMTETVKSMDKLGPMLQKLMSNEGSYGYKRSHLITLFSYEVLKNIDWFPVDKFDENFDCLVFVAFMHDIVLPTEKLIKIHGKIDLYRADLTDQEKELIKNHANIVSSMVQKYPHAPSGSDIIIKQHHGTTNGIGFSEGHNSNLSKQAIILIVVEKFIIRIMNFRSGKDSLKLILEEFQEEFTQPSYKKIVDCLIAIIFNDVNSPH